MWQGWHRVGAPMRDRYTRFVELSNKGARELGFDDTGVLWRSNYDMPPDDFAAEVDRLWAQVQPLYLSLHTYVRSKLAAKYGAGVLPANGMIPAHLVGNMWAQDWSNIYPLVAAPASGESYDLTASLKRRNADERGMVKYAENFFTSLGYQALPPAFWERSLFKKPADREVVCHASASGWDAPEDVRIKMCVQINAEDFRVVHHELGHDYYGLLYAKQPYLYRDAAIDAFHEAVGDTMALSATPGYLKQIGLIDQVPSEKADLEYLLNTALAKVAFLPFGAVIDQWRWKVFSGEIPPADYNKAWWHLRNKYQGVTAPVPRTEADFDPGAKYHMPANTPYTQYFLRVHPAVPVSSCAVQGSRIHRTAPSLLDLRQQGGRRQAREDARNGQQPSVARSAGGAQRRVGDGCDGDSRLFCAAQDVARRAESRGADRVERRAMRMLTLAEIAFLMAQQVPIPVPVPGSVRAVAGFIVAIAHSESPLHSLATMASSSSGQKGCRFDGNGGSCAQRETWR